MTGYIPDPPDAIVRMSESLTERQSEEIKAVFAAGVSAGRKQAAAEVAEDIAAAIETHHARDNLTARQCARLARHHATQYGTEETP